LRHLISHKKTSELFKNLREELYITIYYIIVFRGKVRRAPIYKKTKDGIYVKVGEINEKALEHLKDPDIE